MVNFPHAKINLGLNVLSKRSDGYHSIETCFYPIPWTDILEIIPANEFSFSTSGNPIPGAHDQNLCVKAYHLLKSDYAIGAVKIHLHKIIPTGSGLGGGSSDGTFTLRILNETFQLGLDQPGLINYAARLGSDCSFFIQDNAKLGSQRGEVLHDVPVSLKGKFIIVVKPKIQISTAGAYAGVTPQLPATPIAEILKKNLEEWRLLLVNDFEKSVFKAYPQIGRLKSDLYERGAVYASMSGSGSAVFGIFDQPVNLKEDFSDSEYWSATV